MDTTKVIEIMTKIERSIFCAEPKGCLACALPLDWQHNIGRVLEQYGIDPSKVRFEKEDGWDPDYDPFYMADSGCWKMSCNNGKETFLPALRKFLEKA